MNAKILLIGIAVIIIGGGVYFMTSSDTPDTDATTKQKTQEVATEKNGRASFVSLMDRGEDITCTFSSNVEGTLSQGTFYHSGGNYRVESETQSDGMLYISNMIGLEEKSYIWGTSPQGDMALVISNDTTEVDESMPDAVDTPEDSKFDLEEEVEYTCDTWRADPSMFVPPADVEFMDMQAMFEEMFTGGMPEGFEMPEGMEIPSNLQMQ